MIEQRIFKAEMKMVGKFILCTSFRDDLVTCPNTPPLSAPKAKFSIVPKKKEFGFHLQQIVSFIF